MERSSHADGETISTKTPLQASNIAPEKEAKKKISTGFGLLDVQLVFSFNVSISK